MWCAPLKNPCSRLRPGRSAACILVAALLAFPLPLLAQGPDLRGFRLGMEAEEVFSLLIRSGAEPNRGGSGDVILERPDGGDCKDDLLANIRDSPACTHIALISNREQSQELGLPERIYKISYVQSFGESIPAEAIIERIQEKFGTIRYAESRLNQPGTAKPQTAQGKIINNSNTITIHLYGGAAYLSQGDVFQTGVKDVFFRQVFPEQWPAPPEGAHVFMVWIFMHNAEAYGYELVLVDLGRQRTVDKYRADKHIQRIQQGKSKIKF